LLEVVKESLRGSSLGSILLNVNLKDHCYLSGVIIDVGCGKQPSYHRFWNINASSTLVKIDLSKECDADVIADLEHGLPFRDEVADSIVALAVLDDIYRVKELFRDVHRVLKKGGVFYSSAPFLIYIHDAPRDFWRFTRFSLEKLHIESGFREVEIIEVGGIFSAYINLFSRFFPKLMRPALYMVAVFVDKIFKIRSNVGKLQFFSPLCYLCVAKK